MPVCPYTLSEPGGGDAHKSASDLASYVCQRIAPIAEHFVVAANARAKTVVSNATRWDTFEGLMPRRELPKSEQLFRARYKKSPSFLSIHMGVRAEVFGPVSHIWGDTANARSIEPVPIWSASIRTVFMHSEARSVSSVHA